MACGSEMGVLTKEGAGVIRGGVEAERGREDLEGRKGERRGGVGKDARSGTAGERERVSKNIYTFGLVPYALSLSGGFVLAQKNSNWT